jgi:hypothetical protein
MFEIQLKLNWPHIPRKLHKFRFSKSLDFLQNSALYPHSINSHVPNEGTALIKVWTINIAPCNCDV